MNTAQSPSIYPILIPITKLARDMYFIIVAVDILFYEQLTITQRLNMEIEAEGEERRLQRRDYSSFSIFPRPIMLIENQCLLD